MGYLKRTRKNFVSELAGYKSNIEIAKALDISIKTVDNHRSHILERGYLTFLAFYLGGANWFILAINYYDFRKWNGFLAFLENTDEALY